MALGPLLLQQEDEDGENLLRSPILQSHGTAPTISKPLLAPQLMVMALATTTRPPMSAAPTLLQLEEDEDEENFLRSPILQESHGTVPTINKLLLTSQVMVMALPTTTGPPMSAALTLLQLEEDNQHVIQEVEDSIQDELMMEQVLAAHELHCKIAPESISSMRILLCLSSMATGYGGFVEVFEKCILHSDLSKVTHEYSFEDFLGSALQQTVADTCALVSVTKCVEVQHRWVYEAIHGTGTFPCNAAAPRMLRRACLRKKTWKPGKGAKIEDVLNMIQTQGGVRTTNGPTPRPSLMPIQSWQHHRWDHGSGLTADHITNLLDERGPFVGVMWVCPWYAPFDSAIDRDLVYKSGCGRDQLCQMQSIYCFGEEEVGYHAVLCFAYRLCDGELHVHILDNHQPTGPERWIHFSELEEVFTISVKLLKPLFHQRKGGSVIRYPQSGHETDRVT